jgi:undecaprenyl-diphosphatase
VVVESAQLFTMALKRGEATRRAHLSAEVQPERFLSRPTRAFRVGVSLLGAVLVMAVVVPAEPLGIDQRWSEAMLDMRTSPLTDLALVFNWLGRGLGWLLSLAAVGIVLLARRRLVALLAFALTETVTPLSSTLLKIVVGRQRPPDGLVHPVGSSFPSGHAAYAGATCVALVLLFTAPGLGRARWWWPLAALGVLGMAWSRTYLQVHWLSDVVGGSLLGVGIALTTFAGLQLINSRSVAAVSAGNRVRRGAV